MKGNRRHRGFCFQAVEAGPARSGDNIERRASDSQQFREPMKLTNVTHTCRRETLGLQA